MSDEQKAPTLGDKIRSFAKDGRMLGLSEARIGWLEELTAEADEMDALVCHDACGHVIRPGSVVMERGAGRAFVVERLAVSGTGKRAYPDPLKTCGGSADCCDCVVMAPKPE